MDIFCISKPLPFGVTDPQLRRICCIPHAAKASCPGSGGSPRSRENRSEPLYGKHATDFAW